MTKQELVDKLATDLNVPKAQAGRALDSMFDSIIGSIKSGEKVNISGFGIFESKRREARTARNPKTGETVQVAAKTVAKFKPSKGLKETLNS